MLNPNLLNQFRSVWSGEKCVNLACVCGGGGGWGGLRVYQEQVCKLTKTKSIEFGYSIPLDIHDVNRIPYCKPNPQLGNESNA